MEIKDAIAERRSIRRYKADAVPDEIIRELLDAARLAPSGCNAQPWRFKIVRDRESRVRLAHAAHRQQFIALAPVVIVCAADIKIYLEKESATIQDLGRRKAIDGKSLTVLSERTRQLETMPLDHIGPQVALNVAIAVEHIVLRAMDFGLGTCWVRLFDEDAVRQIFGFDERLHVVTLLTLGYPAENPPPRTRMALDDIILK